MDKKNFAREDLRGKDFSEAALNGVNFRGGRP